MKRLLLTLLTSSILLISCGMASLPNIPDIVSLVNRSLVKVMFTIPEQDATHVCAGFVVNAPRGEVLTARHCVVDDQPILLQGGLNGPIIKSELLRENEQFALISESPMSQPPLELRKDDARVGEESIAIGFPFNIYMVFHRYVAALDRGDFAVDGIFIQGMSGGPVIDREGKVIGIVQAGNDQIGVACGVEEIRKFLKGK